MNIKKKLSGLSLISASSLLFVLSCSPTTSDIAGNSTQTGNGTVLAVAGVLFEQDGISPAPEARVTLHKLQYGNSTTNTGMAKNSAAGIQTVHTDSDGKFIFSSLPSRGPYMIEADQGDTLFAMIEYITINRNDSVVNVQDTLKPPGAMRAVICFNYTDKIVQNARFELYGNYTADLVDPLISYSAYHSAKSNDPWIDSACDCNGVLTFNNVPEGLYTFIAEIQLPVVQTDQKVKSEINLKKPAIFIKSGQVTDLDTLRFPEMDIPDVEQYWARSEYETGTVIIGVTWNASDTGKVSGVNLYQQSLLKLPLKIGFIPLKDSVFVDTGFWDIPRRPKIFEFWYNPYDSTFDTIPDIGNTIAVESICPGYYLTAVDKNGQEAWKVHSVGPSSFWWKKEDGIPFLPDTLPISWPDILTSF